MRPARPSWSERCFASLVRVFFPVSFRRRFGADMRDFFRDRYHEERARAGARGVASLWAFALPDLVLSGTRERVASLAAADQPLSHRTVSLPRALLTDARFATRVFRKHPGFFAVAVFVIALGAGAVSTIFSVANALVLRPVPGVQEASRLVEIGRTRADDGGRTSASYRYYRHLAAGTKSMRGITAWSMVSLNVSTGGQGISALGHAVAGNYFSLLGVRPALGTFFAGDDDHALAVSPAAVISYGFWQRHLAGDSAVIGRTLHVNGTPLTILGVTPAHFRGIYVPLRTDVWLPLGMRSALRGAASPFDDPRTSYLQLVGRLGPEVTRDAAAREMATLSRRYATSPATGESNSAKRFDSARVDLVAGIPVQAAVAVATFIGILLVIATLVLMIASANVASMLLARAVSRRREIAVRMSLGASRGRLVRQLLVESSFLFAAGGALGTLIAVAGTRLIARIELPTDGPPLELDVAPDVRVLAVTLAVSLLTGLLFGLAPAFQGSRLDLQTALRSDTAGAGRRRSRLRDGLVVAQLALSLLLLSSAGLFVRALGKGRATDPGFDTAGVVTAALDTESAGYSEARARTFFRALNERLSTLPGVQAVAYARILPLSMSSSGHMISIPGHTPPGGAEGDPFVVSTNVVDESFFRALRVPIRRGRSFTRADDERAPRVAVVNETFARRYFPDGDALGATFRLDSALVTIVGVSRDIKFSRLDEEPTPFVHFPYPQQWRSTANLLVHTTGAPEVLTAALLRELSALDPLLPVPAITTLRQSTAVVLLPQRVAAAVTGALGLTGLLLAAVGLYGVLAFATAQRTRELGVRLALGASRGGIMRLVIGDGFRLVVIGTAAGLLLASLATRLLRPFLFGLDPLDPLTFAGVAITLGGVALAATYLPARRAAQVDPIASMRQE